MEHFANVTTAQEFRLWEVNDLTPRLKIDNTLAQQCPQIGEYQQGTTVQLKTSCIFKLCVCSCAQNCSQ